MTSYKSFVVLDFESSGLNYYEPDFQVISASFTWDDGTSKFVMGQDKVGQALKELRDTPILVYNLSFELGVTTCVYPDIHLNYAVDVQRLVQLYDSGGEGPNQGFGLKKAVRRILKDESSYEEEGHAWIRANVPEARRGREGAHISKLPLDILERYNVADTENTLRLFQTITTKFRKEEYDWTLDHDLYMSSVRLIVDAKIRGVLVDRERTQQSIVSLAAEIEEMDRKFNATFEAEIAIVREQLRTKAQAKFKKKIVTEAPQFNIGSKAHLKMLFTDLLKMDVGFRTPSGQPSFKSSHMGLYGEGGKLLEKRGKVKMWLNQCKALLELSERDGRWHLSLKAVSTRSGRFSGGS